MPSSFKLGVLEIDGVELEYIQEFDAEELLQAVGVVSPGTEAFSSPGQQSTTSGGWQTKSGYPYTTTPKTAGDYIINHTAQVGNTDKQKQAGHRVQWRPGTSGAWQTLVDIRDANSVDNQFQLRTGFNIVTLASDDVFQVRIQYGENDDGGTTRIREANVIIERVLV